MVVSIGVLVGLYRSSGAFEHDRLAGDATYIDFVFNKTECPIGPWHAHGSWLSERLHDHFPRMLQDLAIADRVNVAAPGEPRHWLAVAGTASLIRFLGVRPVFNVPADPEAMWVAVQAGDAGQHGWRALTDGEITRVADAWDHWVSGDRQGVLATFDAWGRCDVLDRVLAAMIRTAPAIGTGLSSVDRQLLSSVGTGTSPDGLLHNMNTSEIQQQQQLYRLASGPMPLLAGVNLHDPWNLSRWVTLTPAGEAVLAGALEYFPLGAWFGGFNYHHGAPEMPVLVEATGRVVWVPPPPGPSGGVPLFRPWRDPHEDFQGPVNRVFLPVPRRPSLRGLVELPAGFRPCGQ